MAGFFERDGDFNKLAEKCYTDGSKYERSPTNVGYKAPILQIFEGTVQSFIDL